MAPIIDVGGRIVYELQTNAQRTNETDVHEDDMFAICDTFNVLKQIKFDINSPTNTAGTLTLQWPNADGDLTIDLTGAGGGITSLNGLNNSTQLFAIGTSGTGPNWSSVSQTHTLNIPIADNTTSGGGLINTSTQNLYGRKRFNLQTIDEGASENVVEGTISPANTVDQPNDFLVGVWGAAEGPVNAFATGQLIGTLGFAGSSTSSGNISSITGLYGWAQSHSAYSGNLGYIYGGSFLARHLSAGLATGVIGIIAEAMTETASTQSGTAGDFQVTDGSGGSFETATGIKIYAKGVTEAIGIDITDLSTASSKVGIRANIAGSSNYLRDLNIMAATEIKFRDSDSSNYVSFKGASTIASDVVWTLPSADGSSGQVLSTNGSGVLSWASGSASPYWGDAVADFASLPGTGTTGETRVTLDTQNYYQWDGASWDLVGNGPLTIGAIDTAVASANGLDITGNVLKAQSASATVPGMINTAAQTLKGEKILNNTFVDSAAANYYSFSSNATVTNTANSSTSLSITGCGATVSVTDNFNHTGIGIFTGSSSSASASGSGTFTNIGLYGSTSAVSISGTSTHTRAYGSLHSVNQSAASTLTNAYGVWSSVTNAVGSATTNMFAYVADITALSASIGNAYGFKVESISLSGTGNKYSFYSDDTGAPSILASSYGSISSGGNMLLGSTTHATKGAVVIESGTSLRIAGTQNYDFSTANSAIQIQGQTSGASSVVRLFSKDGDGTDAVAHVIYGLGLPGAVTNSESLQFGYDAANSRYGIVTTNTGTGTLRPLHIYTGTDTDQLVLEADGDIAIQDFITINNAAASKYFESSYTVSDLTTGGVRAITGKRIITDTGNNANEYGVFGVVGEVSKSDNFTQSGPGIFVGTLSSFTNDGTANISGATCIGSLGSGINASTGTVAFLVGTAGSISNDVGGTITQAVGVYSDVGNIDAAGTITDAFLFRGEMANQGTITNGYVLFTEVLEATNKYGVHIDVAGSKNVLHEIQSKDQIYSTYATLTDGATINWDASTRQNVQVTLGGNRTLAAATNLKAGGVYTIRVIQDGTGSRTLTWNAIYKHAGATDPTLTATAGASDVFVFICDGTNLWEIGRSLNAA